MDIKPHSDNTDQNQIGHLLLVGDVVGLAIFKAAVF